MSKLVLALLNDEGTALENYHELNMDWVNQFNDEFKKQSENIPDKEKIYQEELVDMTSIAILNNFVTTSNDEEFRVDKTPLKNILYKLFGYSS